jgi:hypothetical protein
MQGIRLGVVAGAACAFAASAQANTLLQIDLNSLTATASSAGFSTGFTGTISLAHDANSTLNGVKIDGTSQTIGAGFVLSSLSGSITTVAGAVTGGSFSVSVFDGFTTDTYSASIVAGSGSINSQAGQGFTIDGLTFSGFFSSSSFAGVDVTLWDSNEPLTGSFLNFAFDPGAGTTDSDADLDVFVVVPLPASGGLCLAGLLGLAGARRRR